jgi:hypothetical protein
LHKPPSLSFYLKVIFHSNAFHHSYISCVMRKRALGKWFCRGKRFDFFCGDVYYMDKSEKDINHSWSSLALPASHQPMNSFWLINQCLDRRDKVFIAHFHLVCKPQGENSLWANVRQS